MKEKLQGLSSAEANTKLKEYGFNEIKELLHISPTKILLNQVKKNFVIYLLFAAALISLFVGKTVTAYAIFAILIILITVGFFQEYKAERAIKALKKIIVPVSIVIRNGAETEVCSRELVPGDILVLRTGDKIPADCIVLEEKELRVNESVITGESCEVKKLAAKNGKEHQTQNIIFMGTHIVNGKCVARVLHTGMSTEFGKIARMISSAEKELPLQEKVNGIAKYMVLAAIFVSLLTGIIMLARSTAFNSDVLINILIVVIVLSVSAFPEGFPVVLISTLASGAYRMAKKNAVVSRMSIIETLGETTVICADKTGTITTGEMTAKHIFAEGKIIDVSGSGYEAKGGFICNNKPIDCGKNSILHQILKTAVLCNDARIQRRGTDHEYRIRGSPTEAALLIMSAKAGLFKEDIQAIRKEEIPFSSERKLMSVLCKEKNGYFVYAKGAPEILLSKSKFTLSGEKITKMDKKNKQRILEANKKFTLKKFRVLALACKRVSSSNNDHFENNLVFLGLVALEDPPREEVMPALMSCNEAGINVKLITGDNKETAVEIAREIGLQGRVLTGAELDEFSDEELSRIVQDIAIFARVRPEHKLRIVKALKENRQIVTMTGDGVNDAPALKEAHIGIAMGKNGTDVAREAADITLKDDNFATIVYAIQEGRTIFNNIQKFITYQLSCNYAELFIIFFAILLGLPLPLLALQILFMNLVTDNLPALTLGFHPCSHDIMKTKPRKKAGLLNKKLIGLIALAGTAMGIIVLTVFYCTLYVFHQDIDTARTVTLVALILLEIANAFNFRSFRHPVYSSSLFTNKLLIYASILSILATLVIIYSPLNTLFGTVPITMLNWVFAILAAVLIVILFDILKTAKKDLVNNIAN